MIKLINISGERPSQQYKMWKFLEGVKPPDKKIKITENQKEDRNKVYESDKRKCKYQKSWEKDREWLHYIVDRNLMKCTICEKFILVFVKLMSFLQDQ